MEGTTGTRLCSAPPGRQTGSHIRGAATAGASHVPPQCPCKAAVTIPIVWIGRLSLSRSHDPWRGWMGARASVASKVSTEFTPGDSFPTQPGEGTSNAQRPQGEAGRHGLDPSLRRSQSWVSVLGARAAHVCLCGWVCACVGARVEPERPCGRWEELSRGAWTLSLPGSAAWSFTPHFLGPCAQAPVWALGATLRNPGLAGPWSPGALLAPLIREGW